MLPIIVSLGTELSTLATSAGSQIGTQDPSKEGWALIIETLGKIGSFIGNNIFDFHTGEKERNFIDNINTNANNVRNLISSYTPIKISPVEIEYAKLLYGGQIKPLLEMVDKYNQLNDVIKNEIDKYNVAVGGTTNSLFRILVVPGETGGTFNVVDYQRLSTQQINDAIQALINLGIIDKKPTDNKETDFGIDVDSVNIYSIDSIINFIKNLFASILAIESTLPNLNIDALQKIGVISTTPDIVEGLDIPTPQRDSIQEPETIRPDVVRDFGIIDELYLKWVERLNLLGTKIDTQTITRTITRTIDESDDSESNRKRGNRPSENDKKNKTIERIKADVSLRSEWIKWVIFTFPKKEDYNSNAKGKLTFVLKDGNSYDIGIYSRGTFSYIATLMLGTGYGWWSAIPRHKRKLTDIHTISYNLPNISTQMRLKAISKELTTDGIYYW